MRKKTTKADPKADPQLLEALNQHPQLKERLLAIVRLAQGQEGTPCTADEIETLLIEEVRQLGRETMVEWAQAQARRVAREAEVGRRWGHCTKAAGWGLRSQIHVVADGAEGMALQSREVFGEQAHFLLDFYHASDYLAAAAERCQPRTPTRWRHTQQRRLKRGAAPTVLAALAPHQEPTSTRDPDAPVRAAHRYLHHRLDQLDYPRALRLELPIGSGLIESGHRHVLQARLKQPGTAWLPDHANALAHLRVLRAHQCWAQLWN